ncbi:MAG TPA: glutathione S-transferase family protein [Rhodospirillaceae bacterium]|nr:glutathione S-transferase family protein [Rhodospirillaceae bacterium]
MITLYTFGPFFGLPDGSPFVTKAMLLLKLAGLSYSQDRGGYGKAPKGKLPFIKDDGVIVADSTLIRLHIEAKYGFDFDRGLTQEQKAVSWAVEKMCEEHLYWAMVDLRWMDDANFAVGPAHFFDSAPAPLRPMIRAIVRRKVRKDLYCQGLGRHAKGDIERMAIRDIETLSVLLGNQKWLMGEAPCGADASMFGFVAGLLTPEFKSPICEAVAARPNLVTYRDRIRAEYF